MSTFSADPWIAWATKNAWLPASGVALYILGVFLAPMLKLSKSSQSLKHALFAWNIMMALFSAWCTVISVPHYLFGEHGVFTEGLTASVCSYSAWFSTGKVGMVTVAFTLSKFVEFGDTVFLALRGCELTNLHTFHHAMTLALTWTLFERRASTGLVCIAMNSFIHTVMYFYYAAVLFPRARSILLPYSYWITVVQISQMVVGVIVNVLATIELLAGRACHVSPFCVFSAGALYLIYAAMFVQFAVERKLKRA